MCYEKKPKYPRFMAVVFAMIPSIILGLAVGFLWWELGLIIGLALFGLGLDVLLNPCEEDKDSNI